MRSESEELIVALDVEDLQKALRLVNLLKDQVSLFKVGLQLYTAAGPEVVREIQTRGGRVFLDLKLHDIPNTVARAVIQAGRLGVDMLTLHTLGGHQMLQQAIERIRERSEAEGWPAPKLLGVTILTSLDARALELIGIDRPLDEMVLLLARTAQEAGLAGIVCSPHELKLLKTEGLTDLLFVIPGIRPSGSEKGDQARSMTPFEAISHGAGCIVVGRPITEAADPVQAVQAIVDEMARARMRP
ncbi:MAG: orotidine-5'-phosphate decarboxylase [Acidobacteriota bacterium]